MVTSWEPVWLLVCTTLDAGFGYLLAGPVGVAVINRTFPGSYDGEQLALLPGPSDVKRSQTGGIADSPCLCVQERSVRAGSDEGEHAPGPRGFAGVT